MHKPLDNVFLIGPMGAGKTTVGRQLAQVLGLEFVDSDQEIERRTGADIPWIFDIEGEAGFRRRERAVIEDLCQRRSQVVATGGGAVLDPDSRADLARSGVVVYLSASADRIYTRTRKSQNRPLLRTQDPRARIAQILHDREPLYREIADLIVDTERRGVNSATTLIVKYLREAAKSNSASTPACSAQS
ncbi:MAG: shikimate kinase AroK [Chromatiales bacterium]|jgi:shikimate kinase|nr:shikimate kinase AroK [Chromatiales bacterium]